MSILSFPTAILLMLSSQLFAQIQPIPGFYNATKPEIASQLLLMPNHEYIYYLSYGAIDQISAGTWRASGNKVWIKEKQIPADPIVIYAASNPQIKAQSAFTFRDFGRTIGIAFSYEDETEPKDLRMLYTEGQHNTQRKQELILASRKHLFFALADGKIKNQYQLFQFTPPADANDFKIQYQQQQQPAPEVEFTFKDEALYISPDGKTELFAHRQDLPPDYERLAKELKKQSILPDTLNIDEMTYHRLNSVLPVKKPVQINRSAYFMYDKNKEQQIQEITVDPIPPFKQ